MQIYIIFNMKIRLKDGFCTKFYYKYIVDNFISI